MNVDFKVPQTHAGGTHSPGFHEESLHPFVHKLVFVISVIFVL